MKLAKNQTNKKPEAKAQENLKKEKGRGGGKYYSFLQPMKTFAVTG